MKYVLILHVCGFLNLSSPECYTSHIIPIQFDTYKECILQGYKSSHNTLKELYNERIEKEKLAIKFECRQVGEKV